MIDKNALKEDDFELAGVPITDRGPWMQVGGGRIFYPLDPRPEEVHIDDIATSLSRIVRYNGHSDIWITVAQHTCNCVTLAQQDDMDDRFLYAMLMHDSAEAYVGDMIRPLKVFMPEFQGVEDKVYAVIKEALEIPEVPHVVIKYYDNLAWAWEKRDFFRSAREWPNTPEVGNYTPQMVQWGHALSRVHFMHNYFRYACLSSLAESQIDKEFVPINYVESEDSIAANYEARDWRDV